MHIVSHCNELVGEVPNVVTYATRITPVIWCYKANFHALLPALTTGGSINPAAYLLSIRRKGAYSIRLPDAQHPRPGYRGSPGCLPRHDKFHYYPCEYLCG